MNSLMNLFVKFKAGEISWDELISQARQLTWVGLTKVSGDESFYETDVNPVTVSAAVTAGLITSEERNKFFADVSDES